MEEVFIYEQKDYDPNRVAGVAREIISSSGVDPRGKSVLLKPSFVYPSHTPETVGVVTQPAFIRGVAMALRDLGAAKVMVGEDGLLGPARSAFYAMDAYSFLRGVAEPVYFDEVRRVQASVPDPLVQETFTVPEIWREADLFVSLPKIKVNQFAKVTLSVKNNLGFLRREHRVENHGDDSLQEKIADLYRVRLPDLVLADSIVAGEGQGPMMAKPVELGVMVGGANGLAVDATACRLMGQEPREVEHLLYLESAGVGPLDEHDIDVSGTPVGEIARSFKRPSNELTGVTPNVRVFEGEECCGFGCRGMVRCSLDAWLERGIDPPKEMNVIIGKNVGDLPRDIERKNTLVVGKCAEPFSHLGTYLPGCPPLPMKTALTLLRFQGRVSIPMKMRDVARGYVAGYGWKAAKFFRGRTGPLAVEE